MQLRGLCQRWGVGLLRAGSEDRPKGGEGRTSQGDGGGEAAGSATPGRAHCASCTRCLLAASGLIILHIGERAAGRVVGAEGRGREGREMGKSFKEKRNSCSLSPLKAKTVLISFLEI